VSSGPYVGKDERAAMIADALSGARATSGSAWVKVDCPFCPIFAGKMDHEKSFAFNRSSTGYTCFRCGVKGYVEGASEYFAAIPVDKTQAELDQLRRPVQGYMPLWPGSTMYEHADGNDAREHLRKRGIPENLWRELQIGVCVDPRYELAYRRLIVPFLADGGWMGWSGRAVWPGAPKKDKYRLRKHPDFTFYNHAALLVETDEPIYIVEGVFDSLAFWPDSAAACGNVTHAQLDVLCSLGPRHRPLVFVPDGDAWEQGLAWMLHLRLQGVERCGSIRLPPKKDPDEVSKYDLWEDARLSLSSDCEVSL